MARFSTTASSPRSPEEVFDFLADMRNASSWDPGVAEAALVAPGEAGEISRGATFDVTLQLAGRPRHATYRIADFDRPHRVVLDADDPAFRSIDTVSVAPAPDGAGATATYDAVLEARGPWRLVSPLVALAFERIGRRAAAGLTRELQD